MGFSAFFLTGRINLAQVKHKAPRLDSELVYEFVKYSHFDLIKVKEYFKNEPKLLHSAWDWGGGDFETAIQACSHVGNKEIAEFLLSEGARMNLFTAVMLGKTEIVQSILQIFPKQIKTRGPHGLGLIHHAKKGGDDAAEVLRYLKQLGAE